MDLQDLKRAYLSRHRASLDDNASHHVSGFVLFLEATLAAIEPAVAAALADGQAAPAAEAPAADATPPADPPAT